MPSPSPSPLWFSLSLSGGDSEPWYRQNVTVGTICHGAGTSICGGIGYAGILNQLVRQDVTAGTGEKAGIGHKVLQGKGLYSLGELARGLL